MDDDARQRRAKEEAVAAAKETAKSWLTFVNDKVTEKVNEKWNVEPFDTLDETIEHYTSRKTGYELVERTENRAALVSKWSSQGTTNGKTALALVLATLVTGGLFLPVAVAVYVWGRRTGGIQKQRMYLTLEVGKNGRVYRTSMEMGPT